MEPGKHRPTSLERQLEEYRPADVKETGSRVMDSIGPFTTIDRYEIAAGVTLTVLRARLFGWRR